MGIIYGGGLKNNIIIKFGYLVLKFVEVRCMYDIILVLLLNIRFGFVINFLLLV